MSNEPYLFFCDTFDHSRFPKEIQVDCVRFSNPVYISEIRIIPLGVAVESKLGDLRLGATNPATFDIDFYVHGSQDQVVFEKIGGFQYKEREHFTNLRVTSQCGANVLVMRGRYATMTIALFGYSNQPQGPSSIFSSPAGQNFSIGPPRTALTQPPPGVYPGPNQMVRPPQPPVFRQGLPNSVLRSGPMPGFTPSVPPPNRPLNFPPPQMVLRPNQPGNPQDGHEPGEIFDAGDRGRHRPSPSLLQHPNMPPHQGMSGSGRSGHREKQPSPSISASGRPTSLLGEGPPDARIQPKPHAPSILGKHHIAHREQLAQPQQQSHKHEDKSGRQQSQLHSSSGYIGGSSDTGGGKGGASSVLVSVEETNAPPVGLYEDGEIQEVDYEEISSNEDLFFELDDPDVALDADGDASGLAGASTWATTSIKESRWRLIPEEIISGSEQAPWTDLEIIADPGISLYKMDLLRISDIDDKIVHMKTDFTEESKVEQLPEAAQKLTNLINLYGTQESHGSSWIEALEGITEYLRPGLVHLQKNDVSTAEKIITTLVNWTFEGLDFSRALQQSDNSFILRHLKVGISLSGQLGSMDEGILSQLLDRNVQNKLLSILEHPLVATTLKLCVLRALDLTTRLTLGIEAFLGINSTQLDDSTNEDNDDIPYRILAGFLFVRKTARVSAACGRLINKLHLFDTLRSLQTTVARLRSNVKDIPIVVQLMEEVTRVFCNAEELIASPRCLLPSETVFDTNKHRPHNPYPNFFHMLQNTQIFSSLDIILCELDAKTSGMSSLREAALVFLEKVAQNHQGLQFLAVNPDSILTLVRHLMQGSNPPGTAMEVDQKSQLSQEERAKAKESREYKLALQLVYKMLTVKHLDSLLAYNQRDPACSTLDDEGLSRSMFGLLELINDSEAGKWAVQVLVMDENMSAFMPLLELIDNDKDLEDDSEEPSEKMDPITAKIRQPVIYQCLPIIIQGVLRLSEDVSYLSRYGVPLAALGKDSNSRLSEIQDWLSPLVSLPTNSPFDTEALTALMTTLSTVVDEVDDLPFGLVTLLRIFRHMIVPKLGNYDTEKIIGVKHKYALVEFYSNDCLPTLLTIMRKVTDMVRSDWQQGLEHVDSHYLLILSILDPLTDLVRLTTQQIIQSRSADFADTTALTDLFNAFTVFCVCPSSQNPPEQVQRIRIAIVDTLLAYTQSELPTEENEEGKTLDKSLWTCLLRELLNFTITTSYTFVGGLTLLAELLPLPLPFTNREHLAENETKQLLATRTLWSAHLLCIQPEFQTALMMIGSTSSPQLTGLLTSICHRISNMGHACANMIAQSTLDGLLDVWLRCRKDNGLSGDGATDGTAQQDNPSEDSPNKSMEISVISGITSSSCANVTLTSGGDLGSTSGPSLLPGVGSGELPGVTGTTSTGVPICPDSDELTRSLNMLRIVLSVPACKYALLKLIGQDGENNSVCEKYIRVYHIFNEILQSHSLKQNYIPTQQIIINCLRQLVVITSPLSSGPSPFSPTGGPANCTKYQPQDLANSLPPKERLQEITMQLTAHVNHPDQDLPTVHMALKCLVLLAEHDYGFCVVKEAVNENRGVFLNLIKRVNDTFSKDNPDCQVTLLTTLELLRTLVITDSLEGEAMPMRTQAITVQEVKDLLGWQTHVADQSHPVTDLHILLKEYVKEEDSLEILLDSMDSLIKLLSTAGDGCSLPVVYPDLPVPSTLAAMFEARKVYQLGKPSEVDVELTPEFWFSLPTAAASIEDLEKPELIRCDLENLAYTCCSGFKLQEELSRGSHKEDTILHKRRRKGQDAIIQTSTSNKKFVAPMRGRGFSIRQNHGSSGGMSGGRHDPFRSRPANTSRPPSMHVDDFVKMEQDDVVVDTPTPNRQDNRNFKGRGSGGRMMGNRKPTGYQSGSWDRNQQMSGSRGGDVKVLTNNDNDYGGPKDVFREPQHPIWNPRRDRHLRSLTK